MNLSRLRAVLVVLLILLPAAGYAQNVSIGPVPGWIKPITPDLKAKPRAGASGGYYYLLLDQQENVAACERFGHYAYKVLTSDGVQEMSDISLDFDPQYQKLTFHEVVIHRNGQTINQLSRPAIKTIQREQSMDRYLYDGALTAIIHLKDVRMGDVIEYTYSRKGYNPIFEGHLGDKLYVDYSIPYEHLYHRLLLPSGKDIHLKYANGDVKPEVTETSHGKEYVWSVQHAAALLTDSNLPGWYDPHRSVQLTDFNSWAEVAAWAVKHFGISESERAQLKTYTAGLFTATDNEGRIREAIRFVQDEIRYLGFETGLNSHKPHAPVSVFDQRFGDCKDKSLLLSSILQLQGVEAYPMLVNTSLRRKVGEGLPDLSAFDHCVVQIRYNNKDIFVDPTINNQGGRLEELYFPDYGKGLVIRQGTTDLIELPQPTRSEITETQSFGITQIGGDATLAVKTVYTGIEADLQRSEFASNSIETIQKNYLTYYSNLYPDIRSEDTLQIVDNRDENTFEVQEQYRIERFWKRNDDKEGQQYCEFYPQSLESYFNVSKATSRKTPYHLSFPTSYHHYILVDLPEEWTIPAEQNKILSDYYDYTYDVSGVGRKLTLYHHYKTKTDYVPADYIDKFLSDHKTMMGELPYYLTYEKNKPGRNLWSLGIVALVAGIIIFIINRRTRPRY